LPAIVQPKEGAATADHKLVAVCEERIARYKVPKAFIRTSKIVRSPAGKADYRWAKSLAIQTGTTAAAPGSAIRAGL
jgi:acyl-CoA synthetase (AMP-forming)/AMP-acid ligase II